MQQYDDSRGQGLAATISEPEQEAQQTVAASETPPLAADAPGSAVPPSTPPTALGAADNGNADNGNADNGNPAPTGDEGEVSMASLLDNPSNAMHELQRGEVIEGTVARIDADEVLVDIGQKSEGVISNRELGPAGESGALRVNQRVLVYVIQPESPEGHAILSLRKARAEQSWRDAEQWMAEDRVIEAPVVDYNKGGLIVEVGVRGFVPISQISELRGLAKGPDSGDSPQVAERLAAMRGRVLKLKIIELNRARNRLILSERLAVQGERAERKEALLHELEPGQIRTGRVTSLASFGAFIDLGGADGLVHISQISYSRVNHPSEVLKVGDEVQVYVLSIDPQTKKIALSLKKAQPDPWTLVEERYKVGDVVDGTITKLAKFGAFARIDDGIEGLIHLSELAVHPVEKPQDVVSEGQEVQLRVIAINSQRRRLGLSLRQAQGDISRPVEVPAEFDEDVDVEADEGPASAGAASVASEASPAEAQVEAQAPQGQPGVAPVEPLEPGPAGDEVAAVTSLSADASSEAAASVPVAEAPAATTVEAPRASVEADTAAAEAGAAETGGPATGGPTATDVPEVGIPPTGDVEAGLPEGSAPEMPEVGESPTTTAPEVETGTPQAAVPETGAPETGVPPDNPGTIEDSVVSNGRS